MDDLKKEMIHEARSKHAHVEPVGRATCLDECFTQYGRHLIFWFNAKSDSTHIITRELQVA